MKEFKDIIEALEDIAQELSYLRQAEGDMGYTIADSLEIIALTMLKEQEKGQ